MKTPESAFDSSTPVLFHRRILQCLWILIPVLSVGPARGAQHGEIQTKCAAVQCFDLSVHPCGFDCSTLAAPNLAPPPNPAPPPASETYSRLPQLRQEYRETRTSILRSLYTFDDEEVKAVYLPEEKDAHSVLELDRALSELFAWVKLDAKGLDHNAADIFLNRVELGLLSSQANHFFLRLASLRREAADAEQEAERVKAQAQSAQRRFDRICKFNIDSGKDIGKTASRVLARFGRPATGGIQDLCGRGFQSLPLQGEDREPAQMAKARTPASALTLPVSYSSHPTEETAQRKLSELTKAGASLKAAAERFISAGGSPELRQSERRLIEIQTKLDDLEVEAEPVERELAAAQRAMAYLRERYLPAIARDIEHQRESAAAASRIWALWKLFDETTTALLKASGSGEPKAFGRLARVEKEVIAFARDEFEYTRELPRAVVDRPQDLQRLETLLDERLCTFQEKVDEEAFQLPSWLPWREFLPGCPGRSRARVSQTRAGDRGNASRHRVGPAATGGTAGDRDDPGRQRRLQGVAKRVGMVQTQGTRRGLLLWELQNGRALPSKSRLEKLADQLGTFDSVISLEELLRLRETD